ncbi:hypothetical protein D910_06942 [Dendroctonus ponderosae]|uniref:Uncharacterized protein n=1 Tax=Dendroctonus ponderosae TaxID=77166 RepID=U4U935_DENPD|nr:hypothetical protein D910_06942 [Dendroctonus ponderosae]
MSAGCPTTPLRPGSGASSNKHHKKTVEHAINCLTTEMSELSIFDRSYISIPTRREKFLSTSCLDYSADSLCL